MMFSKRLTREPQTKALAVFAVAALVMPVAVMSAPMWTLSVISQSGDPIGLGASLSFSQADGGFSTPDILDLTGDAKVDYITFSFVSTDLNTTWGLTFGTSSFANSNPGSLVPGTYIGVQKAPFADVGHPGLDFSLNGIAASMLTGQFTITNAVFKTTANGFEVESFAATFEQFAEGLSAGLTGDFEFVADGGVTPPISSPQTASLLGIGLLALWPSLTRRKINI